MTTQYLDLLRTIRGTGTAHDDRTGTGTRRIFGYQMRFNLQEGFPLLTTKKMALRLVAEEMFWFLSGSTNNKVLQEKNVHIWDEWATKEQCARFGREEGDLGPIYGHQWRNFGASRNNTICINEHVAREVDEEILDDIGRRAGLASLPERTPGYHRDGFDQIRAILDLLINNPNSRRIILTGWNPAEATKVALPQCHTLSQLSVSEGRLSGQLYQRSADVFLGVPFNIAGYALLLHLLAHVSGLEVGDFVHTFGDVHIYNNHFDQVDEQLSREPYPLPKLTINKRETIAKGDVEAALKHLLSIRYEDLSLEGYKSHPRIRAEVSV